MSATHRRLSGSAALCCALLMGLGSSTAHASQAPAPRATPEAATIDPASGWSNVVGSLPSKANGHPKKTAASSAEAFRLNASVLIEALAGAPLEHTAAAAGTLPVISIPGADGELHRFTVVESPVMEPALASRVPFRSYAATSVDQPGMTARLDYSPTLGFHATVRSPAGSWNVDPAYDGLTNTYLAHFGSLTTAPALRNVEDQAAMAARKAVTEALPVAGELVTQRIYKFALASDPGYATLVGAANVDTVKAAITNRVNQIYNDDLAIKLMLVANNNLLALNTEADFVGPNGPCGAAPCFTRTAGDDLSACTEEKRDQTALAITAIIGVDDYDVGQILDPGANGGIAKIDAVGKDADKGAGCSGAPGGVGDFLAVEFLAHEIGHQFGAYHTFSSASCGGFAVETSVEPGSGSTIMSYAGTCNEEDNIQTPSDPYFSQTSIRQIQTYITSTIDPGDNGGQPAENGGSSTVLTANHSPVVTVPAAHVIPVRTPFTLTGTVTDADSGQIPVNAWEQNDLGTIRPLMDNNKTDGPLFRMFSQAAVSPTYEQVLNAPGLSEATAAGSIRTFPDLAQIAAGNTNAASGTCLATLPPTVDQIECFAEFLPTSARTLHFVLSARDRDVTGGGLTQAATEVTVAGTAPFVVTNPAGSTKELSQYAVAWDVAGTTAAPFGVANVKISYSTDGGLSFPTVLSASTPNDGSQIITIPVGVTTTARFKVEAIGQPFFDISHADLAVTAGVAPAFTASTPPTVGTTGAAYTYTFAASGDPAPTFAVASGALPGGLTLNATTGVLSGTPTAAGPFTFTVSASNGIGSPAVTGSITVTISGTVVPVPDYTPLPPARLADTRAGKTTADGQFAAGGRIAGGTTLELLVAGRGGVPATAVAATLNVTVAQAAAPGYVTVYPCGSERPTASNLNYVAGGAIPNAVITKIGTVGAAAGKVCIFASQSLDLIVDVNGWFPPTTSYVALNPARVLDTRSFGETIDDLQQATGAVAKGSITVLKITGRATVPADATAVVLNTTVVGPAEVGYATVFPCGTTPPNASNLNFTQGLTIPNLVVAKIGSGGSVCIYTTSGTHLVADVLGYVPATTTYVALDPVRFLETRPGFATFDGASQGADLRPAGSVTVVRVAGRGLVPGTAATAVLNVTVLRSPGTGYVTVYPCGIEPPVASNLNFRPGQTIANAVITKIGTNGDVCLYNSEAAQLLVDVNGHFP